MAAETRSAATLLPEIPEAAALDCTGLACDSRLVEPGTIFFALTGSTCDGHAFAFQAVARGAVAIVSERPLPGLGVPCFPRSDARPLLARAAARWHRLDGRLRLVGITGTNGKTTTSYLLRSLLGAEATALLGTCGYEVGGARLPASMTTPDPLRLAALLARAQDAGQEHCVMEVSSHALAQGRTAGVDFALGVFTNLSRDHLDYHGSMAAYFDAKARLFEGLDASACAVLNQRDPRVEELCARTAARVVRYASRVEAGEAPDVWAEDVSEQARGVRFLLRFRTGFSRELLLPLPGLHNLENALAAAASAQALGRAPEAIAAGLESAPPVPGRCELVPALPGLTAVVDYAHTDDGLARVLQALRRGLSGRLVCVFGAGGERDRGKRRRMGEVAEAYADVAIVTSDNPRGEAPEAIAREICAGFASPPRVCLDRRAAIRAALREARPGDCVLVAGKGHETTQEIGGRTLPFDDRRVLVEEAARLRVEHARTTQGGEQ